jgi:DNA-binding NtrC family response regulator
MTFSEAMTAHAGHYLSACLEATNGNVSKAAQIAGVHRAHFYSLCQRYCGCVPRKPKPHKPNPFATWHLPRPSTEVRP